VVGNQVWSGATVNGFQPNGNILEILQTQSRASLYWNRFNIDVGQTVRFNQQGNRDWIALNWIADQNPTQIAGRLIADGQIYLINQNGIIFKPGAQVDASAFIASTLQINSNAFLQSLVALRDGRAAFTAFPGSTQGRIEVQSGTVTRIDGTVVTAPNGDPLQGVAAITSAEGGRVFLLATQEVVNAGKIESKGGQIVLAAGTSVFLFSPPSGADSRFRGLYVEVNAGGTARNLGEIISERGNTSLVGLAVNNAGRISADSTLSGNGSVWLLARSDMPSAFSVTNLPPPTRSGEVTLGASSSISIQPRDSFGADGKQQTVLDAQEVFPGEVRVEGRAIHLQGNGSTGATISAPAGTVSLRATQSPALASNPSGLAAPGPISEPDGPIRILMDAGVRIDVSGLKNVEVSADRNIIPITLLGDVVADSPLIRNSPIFGRTIQVDARTGTSLISPDAFRTQVANSVQRGLPERSTAAGTVLIASEGDAILQAGSRVDIQGGNVRYTASRLQTSRLFDGQRVWDVANAPADRMYQAVDRIERTDPRWGVTTSVDIQGAGRFDPGYLRGANAGWLNINSAWIVLDSMIEGSRVVGFYQRTAPPELGRLTLGERFAYTAPSAGFTPDFRTQQSIVVGALALPPIPGLSLTTPRTDVFGPALDRPIVLDPSLLAGQHVGRLEAFTNNSFSVSSAARLNLPAGGRLTVGAGTVAIDGEISVPGARAGEVFRDLAQDGQDFRDTGLTSSGIELSAYGGPVRLAATARLRAAGQNTIDTATLDPTVASSTAMLQGGSVRLRALSALELRSGSVIDVNAGASLDAAGRFTGGNAGSISVQLLDSGLFNQPAAGTLDFGATLTGFGFGSGAAFTLSVPRLTIANQPDPTATLTLAPSFFRQNGFSSVDLNGVEQARIAAGTQIDLRQTNLALQGSATSVRNVLQNAAQLDTIIAPEIKPETTRAPMNFAMRSSSRFRGEAILESGARVSADPRATLRLEAGASLSVDGTLSAPGGAIALTLARSDSYNGYRPDQSIYLSPNAMLNVDSVVLTELTARGPLSTRALGAGTIRLTANEGHVLSAPGSGLSARGLSGTFNFTSNPFASNPIVATRTVSTAGGSVQISALNGGALAGLIDVRAASSEGRPGEIAITGLTPRSVDLNPQPLDAGPALSLSQDIEVGVQVQQSFANGARSVVARPNVFEVGTSALSGGAAGDIRMTTSDRIVLSDSQQLRSVRSVELDAPALSVGGSGTATVESGFIRSGSTRLGLNFGAVSPTATAGPGELVFNASQGIDLVGSLTVQSASSTRLNTAGPVRVNGVFNPGVTTAGRRLEGGLSFSGTLSLDTEQLYPSTFTRYAITGVGTGSRIVVTGSSQSDPGLSAGTQLTLAADDIAIDGTVRAPLGELSFNATNSLRIGSDSVISVSALDQANQALTIPLGSTQDRRATIYSPGQGSSEFITDLPKGVTLRGGSIDIAAGSTVDARGGGDIQASSFVSRGGIGSSGNILLRPNVYAIVPSLRGPAAIDPQSTWELAALRASPEAPAPFRGAMPDTIQIDATPGLRVGDQVELNASALLPAGRYTLLPAQYALLPGAFAVAVTASPSEVQSSSRLADGSQLVPGILRSAGTGQTEPQRLFNVLPQAVVRSYSDFVLDTGNRSFAATAQTAGTPAPRLPQDAGRIAVEVQGQTLNLSGTLALGAADAGRRGELALSATNLFIDGGQGTATPGSTVVQATRLSAIGAESTILGATPGGSAAAGTLSFTPVANSVVVGSGARIEAGAVVLSAQSTIELRDGSQIVATGNAQGPTLLASTAPGALVAAGSNTATELSRATVPGQGSVVLGRGALIDARRVVVSAPDGLSRDPSSQLSARSLTLDTSSLLLGDGIAPGAGATRVDQSTIASLATLERLELRARNEIVLTDNVMLGGSGLGRLDLSTPLLRAGAAATQSQLTAQRVQLGNESGASLPATTLGSSTLSVTAVSALDAQGNTVTGTGSLQFTGGNQGLSGFSSVRLAGTNIQFAGTGVLSSQADLAFSSAATRTSAGIDAKVETTGSIAFEQASSPAPGLPAGLGGRL
jgi:filamentous hemagglutinin family protein